VQASEGQGRRDGGGEVADFQRPRASCCVSCSVCSSNSLPFVHALRALCCCEIPLRPRLLDPSLIGLLLFLLLVDSFFAKYKKKTDLCSCVVVQHTSLWLSNGLCFNFRGGNFWRLSELLRLCLISISCVLC